jgi:glycosyltransferase involved in cell wall biosynthesis
MPSSVQRAIPEPPVQLSIIIPFHRGVESLRRSVEAFLPLAPGWELIIAGDAPIEDCEPLARESGARLLNLPGPQGPAVARNRASEIAAGEVLVFVDADVVASRAAVERVSHVFEAHSDVSAVFGAYDETPWDPGFVSQYKNLAHSYIHQSSATVAQTFWSGFGAVRRQAFEAVGGFDERFRRPSVEDIDLGYRLTAAGFHVRLDPSLRACHLKRWTLWSMIVSDVRDRGIPWTQLILRGGRFNSDLNLKSSYRACVVLAYVALLFAVLGWFEPRLVWPIPFLIAALVGLSRNYYTFFYRQRGLWFVVRVLPVHYLYHLYNGLSFAIGSALFGASRWTRFRMPGALPADLWPAARVGVAGAASRGDHRGPSTVSPATADHNVVGI